MSKLENYLDPAHCPQPRPSRKEMSASTQRLHDAIDAHAQREKIAYLHPDDATIQLDLFGSAQMEAWQEGKVAFLFEGEGCWSELPQVYARYGTDATARLIKALKALEAAKAAVVTDCGMQAVALLADTLLSQGAHAIVMRQVYNKSSKYIEHAARRLGGEVTIVDDGDLSALEGAIQKNTALVFAETFTNPLMRAQDPAALGGLITKAQKRAPQIQLVLDTTIATPWGLSAPALSHPGVGFVVGAGTKALAGQDRDLFGYVASNNVDAMNQLMDLMAMRGGIANHRGTAAIAQGLDEAKEKHALRCKTAVALARFLSTHEKVSQVFHPSLAAHPDRAIIDAHYQRTGALLSFRLKDATEAEARHFCDALVTCEIPRYALSFDGLVTKVNHHKTVSEYFTPKEVLERAGIDRLVRIGVGLETPEDLIACLNWALHHGAQQPQEVLKAWREDRKNALGL